MLRAPNIDSLYRQVMGEDFLQLHPALQRFHSLSGAHVLRGEVRMQAPRTWLARQLARLLGLPLKATDGAIRFQLDAGPERETWTRHFPSGPMTSTLTRRRQCIVEHLGAARLTFRLMPTSGRLSMQLTRLHFFGVPCPRRMLPTIRAEECGEGDLVHFDVSATLPWLGLVSGYCGTLRVPKEPVP